jgi:hypothetical protein
MIRQQPQPGMTGVLDSNGTLRAEQHLQQHHPFTHLVTQPGQGQGRRTTREQDGDEVWPDASQLALAAQLLDALQER